MTVVTWIGVALLGGVGAVLRFYVDGIVSAATGGDLPYGTFLVNVSGSFVLGLLSGLAFSGDTDVLAGTAMIGSYTTFSTWMLESHRLREGAEFRPFASNVVISLGVGLGAVALGRCIGAHI